MADKENVEFSRTDLLDVIEGFIEKVVEIKKLFLGVSVTGLILAPFAMGLSIFLLTHPHFFKILEREDEFGVALAILLGVVISVSVVWMVVGIRQHLALKSWNKHYREYVAQKDEINKKIASDYGLDKD